ncbi:MAG: DUF504 domain-containing protein [Nanoarchaeota archaeon]
MTQPKMIYIKELLNKIKWDKKEHPQEYSLFYYDRIENKLKEIKFAEIKEISKNFLLVEINGKETDIPLHRIRKVEKKGKVVWERKIAKT